MLRLKAAESLEDDAMDEQAMAKSSTSMSSKACSKSAALACIANLVPLSWKYWSSHSCRSSLVVRRLRIQPARCTSSGSHRSTGGSGRCTGDRGLGASDTGATVGVKAGRAWRRLLVEAGR